MNSNIFSCSLNSALRRAVSLMLVASLAACGGGGGSPGTTMTGDSTGTTSGSGGSTSGSSGTGGTDTGGTSTPVADSISLLFSGPELKSAGTPGTEVTVTAVVKNATNNAVAAVPIAFTADSGILTNADAVSDKNGMAKASLGISGDQSNRAIKVTATAGAKSVSGTVNVVGTNLSVVGPANISAGGTGDFVFTLRDSSNAPIPNAPVTVTSKNGNTLTVKTSGGGTASVPTTNAQGQVVVTMGSSQSGTDTVTASALGTSVAATVNVIAANVSVKVVDSNGAAMSSADTTTSCSKVVAGYDISGVAQNGTINIVTSRGSLFSDSQCTSSLTSSSVALASGVSTPVYLKSDTAGIATVTATVPSGPTANVDLEFVAALTSSATISLQADETTLSANNGTGQTQQSALTAVVRDGSKFNNPVKNAVVEFSIVKDPSGGSLSSPNMITTASNGTAIVSYIAGTLTSPQDGVQIQAKIQGTATTANVSLTVAKKALFVSAGTGNKLGTPNNETYQQDYAVFVTDAAGNPVPNVNVTATLIPTRYGKGTRDPSKGWAPVYADICANEDTNHTGIYDVSLDSNGNGKLDPGIPATITANAVTDATGMATVSVLYPRDRADWVEVQLSIHASVAGTEGIYTVAAYWLPVLATDLSDPNSAPPGQTSPYGTQACNLPN